MVELQDPDVARGLRQALSGEVITVVQSEVVARVAAQTSRAAGLGTLYQELLDFDGDELYLSPLPASLIGRPFCDALLASDTCSVLGVMKQSGESILCPGLDHRLEAGDELVVIAADEGAITFRLSVPSLAIQQDDRLILRPPARERLLIIGWNSMAARIAAEIDQHVAAGSEFRILLDPEAADSFDPAALVALEHQRIQIQHGSMIDRSAIAEALAHGPFDHVVVLCPHERLSPLQADAHALLALLHIRNVLQDIDLDGVCTNVVTEVMTVDAVDLAQVARPDDYIVSQRLVSLLIAQLAEDDRRKPVIHEILSARGAQLLLYPVEDCELVGERHFEEIILRMLPLGAVAIGWRARSYVDHSLALHGGIRVNPRKDESVTLFPGDHVIVLHRGS